MGPSSNPERASVILDNAVILIKDYPTHLNLPDGILDGLPDTGSSFTDVYRSTTHNHGIQVKVWRGASMREEGQERFAERLSEILQDWKQAMRHSNVAPFLGVAPGNKRLPALVTPLYMHGNINQYLKKRPEANRLDLLLSVADALKFMHSLNPPVVHGGVRGANILISDDEEALLSDIGVCTLPCDPDLAPVGDGLKYVRWTAPEIFDQDVTCSKAGDVYSFGMTVLEVFTGQKPYANRSRHTDTIFDAMHGILPPRPDYPALTDYIWDLIRSCLLKVENRPSMDVVHAWMLALQLKMDLDTLDRIGKMRLPALTSAIAHHS